MQHFLPPSVDNGHFATKPVAKPVDPTLIGCEPVRGLPFDMVLAGEHIQVCWPSDLAERRERLQRHSKFFIRRREEYRERDPMGIPG